MNKGMLLLIVFVAAFGNLAYGQQGFKNDNLVWKVTQLKGDASLESMAYHCEFITYGKNKITWVQDGGKYNLDFKIKSISGSWSVLEGEGRLNYKVTLGDRPGIISFSRSGDDVKIQMEFLEKGRNTHPDIFIVTDVTPLP